MSADTHTSTVAGDPTPGLAAFLGYAGLLPFYAALALIWFGGASGFEHGWRLLVSYAAIILCFLGAVHWGLVLNSDQPCRTVRSALLWGVTPSLIAATTLALNLGGGAAMLVLAAGFSGQFVADRQAQRSGLCPTWYLTLRARLTAPVLLALILGLLSAPSIGG